LPLAIGLGTLAAFILPEVNDIWLALLIGAALAPTDAALGAGVMVNPAVPARIRRLINVESGLNDGIATPVVLVAIVGAATAGHAASTGPGAAVAELALGLLIGAAAGGGGGWLVKMGHGRGWVAEGFAVLSLALCCYATSVALHGNGFIAVFTRGGLAFAAAGGPAAKLVPFVEETGAMLSLLVWLMFGVVAVVPAPERPDLADGAVRGAQPDRDPDAAGSGRAGPGTSRPARRPVRGLVRPARPGIGRLRAARAGGPGRIRCQTRNHRDRLHRAAQRPCPRAERRSAGQPLPSPAHGAARRGRPGRAGRDTRTTPHPPRTRRQPPHGKGT
jgi:hypothetical protein